MNDSFTFLVIATAMLIVTVALLKIGKVRYVYIVPEGYAGLLYHEGEFVAGESLARFSQSRLRAALARRSHCLEPCAEFPPRSLPGFGHQPTCGIEPRLNRSIRRTAPANCQCGC